MTNKHYLKHLPPCTQRLGIVMKDSEGEPNMLMMCGLTPVVHEECVRCGGFKSAMLTLDSGSKLE